MLLAILNVEAGMVALLHEERSLQVRLPSVLSNNAITPETCSARKYSRNSGRSCAPPELGKVGIWGAAGCAGAAAFAAPGTGGAVRVAAQPDTHKKKPTERNTGNR